MSKPLRRLSTLTAVVLVALACSRARDGAEPSARVDDESGAAGASALPGPGEPDAGGQGVSSPVDTNGACGNASCVEPAPGAAGGAVWSRDPATGGCTRHERRADAPPNLPLFDTEVECQISCRCSTLEDFIDDVGEYNTERTSLECRCSAETCPSSIAEAEQTMCNRPLAMYFPVERREGCGKVVIADANGLAGDAWVFERPLESTDAGDAS
ncbi:MAG TPA: hypothetical protein VMG12_03005, partial [Polyangiaceae bacterium]|nr:hypothetical protein [Polyangiaceae bacterium]